MDRDMLDLIASRHTVRSFDARPVSRETLDILVEAGRWAPSGLNNQPWRFVTVEGRETLDTLAGFTKYGKILRGAQAAVAVFLDGESSYSRVKDIQGVGAAIENMLLAAHSLGLGACWLGEILNRREEVEAALKVPTGTELMAVVALGWPKAPPAGKRERFPADKLIIGRF